MTHEGHIVRHVALQYRQPSTMPRKVKAKVR
jgi:hypothetical protein